MASEDTFRATRRMGTRPLVTMLEIDGRNQGDVSYDRRMFSPITFRNYTMGELGHGYPRGPLNEFEFEAWFSQLGTVLCQAPQSEGYACLDFEQGLWPWPNRAHSRYIGELKPDAFQALAMRFFVGSLEVARRVRPRVHWGLYGFPPWYASHAEIDDVPELWNACDILTPSIYVIHETRSDVALHVRKVGERVRRVRNLHLKGSGLDAFPLLWDRLRSFQPVPMPLMLTAAMTAEEWADGLNVWMAAGDPFQADQCTAALAPGGHVSEFLRLYRSDLDAPATDPPPPATPQPPPVRPPFEPDMPRALSSDEGDSRGVTDTDPPEAGEGPDDAKPAT